MLSLDLRALALLRIAYGGVLIQDLLVRATDLTAHYTDYGIAPRSAILELNTNPAYLCIHMLNGTWPFQALLFLLAGLVALCLVFGYRTRTMSIISYIHLASLHSRNEMIEDGGDTLLRVVFFWCLFVPWGARWSIDAYRSRQAEPASSEIAVDNRWFDASTLAYMAQLSFIYVFASVLKTSDEWRVDGTAVQYALMINQLSTKWASLLLAHPPWMKFLNFATLDFEAYGPILFWLPGPLRLLGALGIQFMHASFGFFIHLGVFCSIGMASPLGLWPGFVFDSWEKTRLYRWVSARFATFAEHWPLEGCQATPVQPPQLNSLARGAVVYLIVCVFFWNVDVVPNTNMPLHPPGPLISLLRLDQGWNMFAPKPLNEDGWYVIDAEQVNGKHIDLFQHGAPVSWAPPADIAATYRNARWRKFMMNIWAAKMWNWRLYYGRYLTRAWNDSHTGGEQIKTFQICFMLTVNQADGTKKRPEKNVIWIHQCFDEKPTEPGISPTPSSSTPTPTASPTGVPTPGGKPAAGNTPVDQSSGSMPRT